MTGESGRGKRAETDVLVVGAGVVGLSCALMLQARGLSVAVIDRKGPAAEASAGNAGAFAFPEILPLASPGILRRAPRWLLDPLGPLAIPPGYAPHLLPWLWRFWRASRPNRVQASTVAQAALMALSEATLTPFLEATGTLPMLRRDGQLVVYESAREFQRALPGWELRRAHGVAFRHLQSAAEIAAIQPGLAERITQATFTPGWLNIADPKAYTLALADCFQARGGRLEIGEVRRLTAVGEGVAATLADGGQRRPGRAVVAAGAWSHRLCRTLGERIPLETERGYNTTLPGEAFDLRCQITFGEHGFVISRLSSGIRVGGAVELGGLAAPPNYARADAMLAKARRFLPGLKTEGGVRWMGFRPSLPDSLPVIGPARASDRVIYAFGHGHLGLTQSTGTAALVADLVTGRPPALDLSPFSPARF